MNNKIIEKASHFGYDKRMHEILMKIFYLGSGATITLSVQKMIETQGEHWAGYGVLAAILYHMANVQLYKKNKMNQDIENLKKDN